MISTMHDGHAVDEWDVIAKGLWREVATELHQWALPTDAERGARAWFRKCRQIIPTPGRWFQFEQRINEII